MIDRCPLHRDRFCYIRFSITPCVLICVYICWTHTHLLQVEWSKNSSLFRYSAKRPCSSRSTTVVFVENGQFDFSEVFFPPEQQSVDSLSCLRIKGVLLHSDRTIDAAWFRQSGQQVLINPLQCRQVLFQNSYFGSENSFWVSGEACLTGE